MLREISCVMDRGTAWSASGFVQRFVAQIREAVELAVKIQKNFEGLGA